MSRTSRLFYLIGASGAGKDSLLRYARENAPASAPLIFSHRYITRPADAGGENHVALSHSEFTRRERHGCFAMHWHSHGLDYGIGVEILQWLAQGLDVVVNGSRGYLAEARMHHPALRPVLIQAPEAILRERLKRRGRESSVEIEQRIRQARDLDREMRALQIPRICNDGELAGAGERLLQLLLARPDTMEQA